MTRSGTDAALAGDALADAVALANIPTLLAVLAHLTGDERWTSDRFQPTPARGLDDNDDGGLPAHVQREVRDAAAEAIRDADTGRRPSAARRLRPDALVQLLSMSTGETIPAEYGPMLQADLDAIVTAGSPVIRPPRPTGRRAVIIGAGVSGIAAAVALSRAGISCTILERNTALGGTWLENSYPGAGVDTPSHLYQYSFAPHDWPEYFSAQPDVRTYLEQVADRFDVRRQIRFDSEVRSARFDETTNQWLVEVADGSRPPETITADFLVSAVGAFNQPKLPAVDGIADFAGPSFHTARWPQADLRDKRVAIVGNGASAMQVVPAIAAQVRSLTIFQRSPHWIAPFTKLHTAVPDPVRALLRDVPLYHGWYRQRLAWTFNDKLHPTLKRDPAWPHPERSLNAANDRHRAYFTSYIENELQGRPDLIKAMVPSYPPYGKRILLDNGWYRTLVRDNVEVVTSPVARLETAAVCSADGEHYDTDAVVFATGFDVVSFLSTLDVIGRDGQSLYDVWDGDDARAFLGLAVPGFPNLFILYGPNTQPGHGGSLITAVEAQLHYIVSAIRAADTAGSAAVEVRRDVYEAYNAEVDQAHEQMVWTHPGMETYYRNKRGRVVVNTPFRVVDFWTMTRTDPRLHLTAGAA